MATGDQARAAAEVVVESLSVQERERITAMSADSSYVTPRVISHITEVPPGA